MVVWFANILLMPLPSLLGSKLPDQVVPKFDVENSWPLDVPTYTVDPDTDIDIAFPEAPGRGDRGCHVPFVVGE